jgi:hypothetical protein
MRMGTCLRLEKTDDPGASEDVVSFEKPTPHLISEEKEGLASGTLLA